MGLSRAQLESFTTISSCRDGVIGRNTIPSYLAAPVGPRWERPMKTVPIERRSAVLTSSRLACLANVATINLTAGCAHRCIYCYAQGYSTSPRDGTVHYYENTADKLAEELRRKRKLPRAVYFSPSSDLFQPVSEVLDMAMDVLGILFERRVNVSFLTKGRIPRRHMALLKKNASFVQAQIGLTTVDEAVLDAFEPHAAAPEVRLAQAKELVEAGIATTGRLDPILPGLTSDEESLREVCSGFAATGVRIVAASTLFLRPAISHSLRESLRGNPMCQRLFDAFCRRHRLAIHAERSSIVALPEQARREIYERLESVAGEFGLQVRVCACKNPDLSNKACHIAGRPSADVDSPVQVSLF